MIKKVRIKENFWNIKTNPEHVPSESMKSLGGKEYTVREILYGGIHILESCKSPLTGLYYTWSNEWLEECVPDWILTVNEYRKKRDNKDLIYGERSVPRML